MADFVADVAKQSGGRWQAFVRRLNGEVLWTSDRIHATKRAAMVEALKETTRTSWVLREEMERAK